MKNHYYRIAVSVKAEDLSGNAYITFKESDVLKEEPHNFTAYEPKTTSLSISSTTANALKNGYNTYEIYVAGHELHDTIANLELSLGNADGKASGKVAFDNILISKITHDQFASVTTSSSVTTLTLSTIESDSDINGFFNKAHSEKAVVEYPLIPEDWTRETEDNNELTTFGVVNTSEWHISIPNPYNANRLSGDTFIPVPAGTSNNILMAHNGASSSFQTIKSPDLEISSGSFYTLSLNYLAHGNEILNIKIVDNNGNVVYQELALESDSWAFYEITINTEYYGSTLNLIFEVGTEDAPQLGYAYFDNVQLVQETDYEDEYAAIVENGGNVIDFSNGGFNMVGSEIETDIYEALMFESNNASGAVGGIVTDAIDTIQPKCHLIAEAWRRRIKIVSSMGAGAKSDITQIRLSDLWDTYHCGLAKAVRNGLKRMGMKRSLPVVFSTEQARPEAIIRVENEQNKKSTTGTVSYMPATFGCFLAGYVITSLRGR